ncbi:MAG: DNA primase [Pseudomonadota bacterium]
MAGRIPDSFIEELLARTDIVEVIDRRVPLKRTGNEFQALCPFHNENTPSFTVSPSKQFYHCFGCGAHGSAIGFLMEYEGLEFRDAVEDLAKSAGLEIPEEAAGFRPKPTQGLLDVMDRAAGFFQQSLKSHAPAIEYLKQRGLSGEICRDFGVGYAPASWDALQKHLGTGGESIALMKRGGLLSQGDRSAYDKFRDRIMFPIHDRRGRVIGFGGRAIADDGPKYLNSPETELFHKGRELYGLFLARKTAGKLDSLVVVEGYMDVVALAQFGIRNAVATLGTATTPDQAALLLRATDTVIYCFDGDRAGREAAWKALKATLPKLGAGKQAKFLFLPDGEDPDTVVRSEGAERFRALLDSAQSLSDFFFDRVTADVDMESIDGRAAMVQDARPLLEALPEGVFRDMMFERLETLARHRLTGGAARPASVAAPRASAGGAPALTPMRLAMALLLQNPSLGPLAKEGAVTLEELEDHPVPGVDLLRELVDLCCERPHLTTAQVLETLRAHEAHAHLVKFALREIPGDAEQRSVEFLDALAGIRLQRVEADLAALPRIVDQDPEQKAQFRALQAEKSKLRDALRGRKI